MKPHQANLLTSAIFVIVGLWSYEASGRDLHTLSIPVIGILLSFFYKPLKENRRYALEAVGILSSLIVLLLLLPMRNTIQSTKPDKYYAVLRVSLMLAAVLYAVIIYYKEYRNRIHKTV
ncbi:MAG TPA: hypothetical protein PKD32_06600 [Saprospiraceae bacterium]|jgi:hypothetical protein|nr:hypothetical protein [Saprospiraceae bacterium]HMS29502.1 hypothetical protein [Saprospiraceae bacterium]